MEKKNVITLDEAKEIVQNINALRAGSRNPNWKPLMRTRLINSALKQEIELKERLCDPKCKVDLRSIGMQGVISL
jgi:hypothetical protein